MTQSFRGVSARNFAMFLREFSTRKNSGSFSAKTCGEKNDLREHTRNLAKFFPQKFAFENFCSWSEREKRVFFLD